MRAHISVVFDLDVLVKLRDMAKAKGTTPSKLVERLVLQKLKEGEHETVKRSVRA